MSSAQATDTAAAAAREQQQRGHFLGFGDPNHKPSILQQITEKRYRDVEEARHLVSEATLLSQIASFDAQHGAPLDLYERIAQTEPQMAIAAEFKRASPSKGDIAPGMVAAEQGLLYASVGAAVLSVLTEPFWFKGTVQDMREVREATQAQAEASRASRPAVLRKDFVVDEYMVLEARANGADTVLLIVAILEVDQLKRLMACCRAHGIEPLVEVHTDAEMEVALDAGARVIGVNSRNLHTFKLDMEATQRVSRIAAARGIRWGHRGDIQLAALSGITGPAEVDAFRAAGVSMVLVGETLMRAADPREAIRTLLGQQPGGAVLTRQLAKICGVTRAEDALAAAAAGANLIGVIFAERSKRRVSVEAAREIVAAVRAFGERSGVKALAPPPPEAAAAGAAEWFTRWAETLTEGSRRTPLVVGVFQDQPLDHVRETAAAAGLDLVQLHGDEGWDACAHCGVPALRVVHVPTSPSGEGEGDAAVTADAILAALRPGAAAAVLLDTSVGGARGGTGAVFDHALAARIEAAGVPVIVAGGLAPGGVGAVVAAARAWGVDASSGVEGEVPGVKDAGKVAAFLREARAAHAALARDG
ncbi:indole-3-glycerol phosphate synthase-domain-containing protein [Tribonema minus]|uniref:Indole-3-glycerol phosphate synthase-domain-containing protein n=1 Tax=Tribonema minus TaxID=303371 RepID=A0A835YVM1_9STRA|nr:indole-3-glycerol phosphate synthase-domain-containing protein [Tribonema minus]